jgi:hypothetical protein
MSYKKEACEVYNSRYYIKDRWLKYSRDNYHGEKR